MIVDFKVYKDAVEKKLRKKYLEDGIWKPKYKEVSESVLKKHHRELKAMAEEGVEKGYICEEDGAVMVPKEPTAARFYMNSKDHKPIDPRTGVPPWREVISGSGSNTEGSSRIVNHHLNPINKKLPSYIEDTRHMLIRVRNIIQHNAPLHPLTRLVTIDAVAMYPSIPKDGEEGGVKASERALTKSGMEDGMTNWIIRLLQLLLLYNVFEWDGKLFQQLFGTAIGTSCAPPYSCIYMEEVTDEAFDKWREAHPDPDHNMDKWARLIDDG